ncbi:hypothetical protein BY996DRAFT_6410260 [Phakopsora pachyrhizi]|nr:hypothetical protein BY996DRAFT_6410260 [Phakopsora pachyrhizi]
MTEIPTPSSNEKYESFKNELVEVEKRIGKLSVQSQKYVEKSYDPIQRLIRNVLVLLEEEDEEKKKTLDASKMRLNEFLDEVKGFLLYFYKQRKKDWEADRRSKSFIMSEILKVLDPLIKYGFLTTEEIQPWLKDSEVLRSSAYFLSSERYLYSKYWLPSVEELANHSKEEYLWLSMLKGQEEKVFLRQLIGFTYAYGSGLISHSKISPVVKKFLKNPEVTKDTFNILSEAVDSDKFYGEMSGPQVETISNFLHQALTYLQSYAPAEVKSYYSKSRFSILWEKKKLLDDFCQARPISKNYGYTAEKFKNYNDNNNYDYIFRREEKIEYKIDDFKNVLKALRDDKEGLIKTGYEKASKDLLEQYPTVNKHHLNDALEFRAKIKQISDSLSLIPAKLSNEIYRWFQLSKQKMLLETFERRALFLDPEIRTLRDSINKLRTNKRPFSEISG